MNITRGDIYYIQRSGNYQGNEIAKDRPGIIVSADHLNAGESCVEVVYLTTQPKRDMEEHVPILSSGRTSTALCEQIYTVTMQRLGNYYGRASESEMRDIDRAIASSLGLRESEGNEYQGELCVQQGEYEELLRVETERDTYKSMYENLLHEITKKVMA